MGKSGPPGLESSRVLCRTGQKMLSPRVKVLSARRIENPARMWPSRSKGLPLFVSETEAENWKTCPGSQNNMDSGFIETRFLFCRNKNLVLKKKMIDCQVSVQYYPIKQHGDDGLCLVLYCCYTPRL